MASPSDKLTKAQIEMLRKLIDEGADLSSLLGKKQEVGSSSRGPIETSPQTSEEELDISPIRQLALDEADDDCIVVEPPSESTAKVEASEEKKSGTKKRQRMGTDTPRRSSRRRKMVFVKSETQKDDEDVRQVVPDLVLEKEFLQQNRLSQVVDLLRTQGWVHLFEEQVMVDESLVRQFYEKLTVEERPGMVLASFTIGTADFTFTSRELSALLKVPHSGFGDYIKGQWPANIPMEEVVNRVGRDVKQMSLPTRVLHRIVNQGITPRLQKHTSVNFQDYLLMDKIQQGEQVNLAVQVMLHMGYSTTTIKHGLPFPGFVKTVLQSFGVYLPKSEVKAFFKFDSDNCGRLGFVLSGSGEWIPKADIPTGKRKDDATPAKRRKEGPLPAVAPSVDLTPVLERLDGVTSLLLSLTEKIQHLSDRVDTVETKVKDLAEHTHLNLALGHRTTDLLAGLTESLNKFGTRALEEMRMAYHRR